MNSLENIFPLKGRVTWEILMSSQRMSVRGCVGAVTLRTALGEFANGRIVRWGNQDGVVDDDAITTLEEVEMMNITEPTEVTFILKPKKNAEHVETQDS